MRRTLGATLMAGTLALVGGLGFGADSARADGFGPRGYGYGYAYGYGYGKGPGGFGHGHGRGPGYYGKGPGGFGHGPGRHYCHHHRRWDCSCRPTPPPPPPVCGPRPPRPYPAPYGLGSVQSYTERVYETRTSTSYSAPYAPRFPY